MSNGVTIYPCPHRDRDRCTLGRFRGKPSVGACAVHCDIGAKLVWPMITAPRVQAPYPGTELLPRFMREGCCGDGAGPPVRP
ncbi:MAG: hypothetical protein KF724_12925 [Phycisphaeraceae bacterium]|nr:hypothetical protein [Phycisphaeraceae bacterium]